MFADSLMTGLILLVVVFAVLVLLSVIIWLFGQKGETKPKAPLQSKPAPKKPVAVSAAPAPAVYAEDEDEIAAVIAAAVAMMAPAGMVYRVKKILPAGQKGRSEWASAAIRQNTMPF